MLHAEAIYKMPVIIIHRVAITSIEIIIHQSIANHNVVRIDVLVLLVELKESLRNKRFI